jgi:pilus assembly protein FimV
MALLSTTGQPIQAEIEILEAVPGEAEEAFLSIGSPKIYQELGLDYNPALEKLHFSIERRGDQLIILKVSTDTPLTDDILDLIIQLRSSESLLQRHYTLILDTKQITNPSYSPIDNKNNRLNQEDNTTTKEATQTNKPITPSTPNDISVQKGTENITGEILVKPGDNLSTIALQHLSQGASLEQMTVAFFYANRDAFIQDNINLIRAGENIKLPTSEEVNAVSRAEAFALLRTHTADFNAYRQRIAQKTARANEGKSTTAKGKIEIIVSDDETLGTPDKLTLSKNNENPLNTEDSIAQKKQQDFNEQIKNDINNNLLALEEVEKVIQAEIDSIQESDQTLDSVTLETQENISIDTTQETSQFKIFWERYKWWIIAILGILGLLIITRKNRKETQEKESTESQDTQGPNYDFTKISLDLDDKTEKTVTPSTHEKIDQAEKFYRQGDLKRSKEVLQDIASYPLDDESQRRFKNLSDKLGE